MQLRRFARTASAGCSPISIISSVWTISMSSPSVSCLASSRLNELFFADEQDANTIFARRLHGAKHDLRRRVVAAHRVDGDTATHV